MTDSSSALPAENLDVGGATREIARRYAEALINAAQQEGVVEPVLEEFSEIERDVLEAYPRFAEILASARVSSAEKDRILLDLFNNRASSLGLRFLRVLNRHERLGLLRVVIREARALWDQRNHRIPVRVHSAIPLDEDQLISLRDRLARLTAATPILNVSTDPSLIGGLVVQIGDLRYDASVKSRLLQLRQRLIEGKTHEIQSRRDQFSHPA
jgi:F-type H+-transporting ATPase subunit delta